MTDDERRFAFGRNWRRFLRHLDDERIAHAEACLAELIPDRPLAGRSFLDVGSGSGLSSLAAQRLGAEPVHSFDYDADSVACTAELRRRHGDPERTWTVERGSILDADYVAALGTFDVVHAWGVLHHTGSMWRAVDLAASGVAPGGLLVLALYNDQGWRSRVWRAVKRLYVAGWAGRALVLATFVPLFFLHGLVLDLVRLRDPRRRYREYRSQRGMSVFHDWIDWLGGYPFEVTRPDPVIARLESRGFRLLLLDPTAGLGNHQFVFERPAPGAGDASASSS